MCPPWVSWLTTWRHRPGIVCDSPARPWALPGEQLVQLERRVEVAYGELLVGGPEDEVAHHAAVERVAPRGPQDRPVDRLDLLDRGVGLELAYDLLRVGARAKERGVGA